VRLFIDKDRAVALQGAYRDRSNLRSRHLVE
jgi:hypothetical protein